MMQSSTVLTCATVLLIVLSAAQLIIAQTSVTTKASTQPSTTTGQIDKCNVQNITCEQCLKNIECFFCDEDSTCKTYKAGFIFPENCASSKSRWLDCPFCCSLDVQALLIASIVIAVFIVLLFLCCICYCCNKTCKSISDRNLRKLERRLAKQKEELKQRSQARKEERQAKNDAIRVKYGLKPSTYTQIEN